MLRLIPIILLRLTHSIDGNKRVAAAVSEIFLELNGARLTATDEQIVTVFCDIAASKLSRDEVEEFFTHWTI